MTPVSSFRWLFFSLSLFCVSASAAPILRLSTAAVYVSQREGAAPANQTVLAHNIGDGSLHLTVSVSPAATWLTPSVGAPQACSINVTPCIPLRFSLSSISLRAGTYTAEVTVSDSNAIDAPQVVTVTMQVGAETTPIDVYVNPGISFEVPFPLSPGICIATCPTVTTMTTDGGSWLSIGAGMQGTIAFPESYFILFTPAANMALGTYTGAVTVTNSNQNGTYPVAMQVVNGPIALPSTPQITVSLAQNGPPLTYPFLPSISLSNRGTGSLVVQGVTASGTGVSAYDSGGLAIVTLNPGSLPVGTYTDGVVTFECNAANCPLQVPVHLQIVPQSGPVIQSASPETGSGNSIALGDNAVITGEQLSLSPAVVASGFPLPETLGGARVLVNGSAVPLYYSSYGQIAFQMPTVVRPPGKALLQVERDQQVSNTISVVVPERLPEIVKVTDTSGNVRDVNHPTTVGETLVIWAIGLGPTNPPVPQGEAAPSAPAVAVVTPTVEFSSQASVDKVTPTLASLAPGQAGLYQVTVTVPPMASGTVYIVLFEPGVRVSPGIAVAVQ